MPPPEFQESDKFFEIQEKGSGEEIMDELQDIGRQIVRNC